MHPVKSFDTISKFYFKAVAPYVLESISDMLYECKVTLNGEFQYYSLFDNIHEIKEFLKEVKHRFEVNTVKTDLDALKMFNIGISIDFTNEEDVFKFKLKFN